MLQYEIYEDSYWIMTFLNGHVALLLCLYLDCDINKIKVLQGFGLVMFATFLDVFVFAF